MVTDMTQQIMANYLENRKGRNRFSNKFPWKAGKNHLRLLPFTHTVTEHDLKRQGRCALPFKPEHVGQEISLVAVPLVRYFIRTSAQQEYFNRKKCAINGLGTRDCPMFEHFIECKNDASLKNAKVKPVDMFVANAVCMDEPELGVLQVCFSRSEWLGALTKTRAKSTYGLWDVVAGYDPSSEEEEQQQEDDEEQLSASAGLDPLEAWGSKVYGWNARDLIVVKRKGIIGNNPCLLLDEERKGGPISIRGEKSSAKLDPEEFPTKDLLVIPDYFPGWASDGDHLTEDALTFVSIYGKPAPQREQEKSPEIEAEEDEVALGNAGAGETPAETSSVETATDETETKEKPKPASKKRRGRPRKKPVEVGSRVTFKDEGIEYIGTVLGIENDEDGKAEATVELKPDDQPTDDAKAAIETLNESGHDCTGIAVKRLKVI